jgi:hypothetical protein
MFKQLRDGWKAPKIIRAMNAADAAITANRIDIAESWLGQAYKLSLDTTMPRILHTNMILAWGVMGMTLEDRGHADLAAHCAKMRSLLQARLDAGDYYGEND